MFEFADGSAYKILSKQGDTMEVQYATAMFRKTGKKIIIPDEVIALDGTVAKVISIEERAFWGKTNITNVTIGKNVKTIGEEAFYGCKKLKSLTLGSNVTTIGNKAFYKCVSLKKVVIPTKVNKIGKQAFYGCKNLKNITIKTKKLTSKKVGSNAFKKVNSKVSVKVPKSKLRAYKKLLKAKGIGSKAKIKKIVKMVP